MSEEKLNYELIKANVKYELCISKLEAIQECCRFETDDPDAELMRTDTKGFADKMKKENPKMSDIEIGVHIGLLEKADSIMAIIKRKESEDV
mgnify:CR=1 FL=1